MSSVKSNGEHAPTAKHHRLPCFALLVHWWLCGDGGGGEGGSGDGGVVDELLEERGDANRGPQPQGRGPHDEQVEGLKKLELGLEGGHLDRDRR